MRKMVWDDSLSVGVDLIDAQHRTWIDHFNRAAEAVGSGQGPAQITRTLGFLIAYTEEHFKTEEKHMDTFLGNWLVDHIQETDTAFGAFLKEKGLALS